MVGLLIYSTYWLDYSVEVFSDTNVLSLITITILFALLQIIWTTKLRNKQTELENELNVVFNELKYSKDENQFKTYENKLITDFYQVEDPLKALNILLKRFLPNPSHGISGFAFHKDEKSILLKSRGMSHDSIESFNLDPLLIDEVKDRKVIILKERRLRASELYRSLSAKDRKKIKILYLFDASNDTGHLVIFFTAVLYPTIGSIEKKLAFTNQILSFLSILLKRTFETKENLKELKQTKEILELRSITDNYDLPSMEMTRQFLACLMTRLNAESISTYISTADIEKPVRVLVRTEQTVNNQIKKTWEEHEDTLALLATQFNTGMILDTATLQDCGVKTIIRSGLTVPMIHKAIRIGEMVITRKNHHNFSEKEYDLAEWAGKHLASTISRIINQATIAKEARVDQLTQLSNRREFDKEIIKALNTAKQLSQECALLFCDIDHFKNVNDTYGHQSGDAVLQGTAKIIKDEIQKIRSTDRAIMARYGGEELAILLPGISAPGAFRIANTIREKIQKRIYRHGTKNFNVTISIGIGIYPNQADSVQELISVADSAVYRAKKEGRNRVVQLPSLNIQ